MDRTTFQIQQTVLEVLSQHPTTRRAFQTLKTQCVGCSLARFCTLKDVAEAYEIPPQALLDELSSAAVEIDESMRSKS